VEKLVDATVATYISRMSNFVLLQNDVFGSGLKLLDLKGYDNDFLLGRGDSLLAEYPKKTPTYQVEIQKSTSRGPGGRHKVKLETALTDSLVCQDATVRVVSEKMMQVISAAEKQVEFLPVQIKGFKEPYFIANLLNHIPCLDVAKCGNQKLNEQGQLPFAPKKLVVKAASIPSERALFQVKEFSEFFLVRNDVAAKMKEAHLTGMEFMELDAFDGS
jgi:hypothetical protein